MLQAARKHVHTIVVLGVSAALVVGGVAAAQSIKSGSGSSSQGKGQQAGSKGEGQHAGKMRGRPGGPPAGGVPMKGLTYGEFHVQKKDGEAAVIRVDQGKIKSVDDSSITLVENDESEVTIALDSDTKVVGKPGKDLSVSDLKEGQKVVVSGPKGGTADTIAIPPKKGAMKGGKGDGQRPQGPMNGQGPGQAPSGEGSGSAS